MKTVNGHDVPSKEQIQQKIATIEKTISKTTGITNLKTSLDFDNYIAIINFNFNKVDQLNDAIKNISNKENNNKPIDKAYLYNAQADIFTRLNNLSLKEDYKKMNNTDKEIFATANYTTIYKFESNIASVSNKEAKISPSKKAVMLNQNALDLITNKKSIENKITLTTQ